MQALAAAVVRRVGVGNIAAAVAAAVVAAVAVAAAAVRGKE